MSLHQLWQKLLDWQSNSARPQSSQAFTGSSQARLRRNRLVACSSPWNSVASWRLT
jgi:hypothetical protein